MASFGTVGVNLEEIIRNLQAEFRDDAAERLADMTAALDQMAKSGPREELLSSFRRQAHNLKGMGGSFGFPAISEIAHRLESYLNDLATWNTGDAGELQRFIDKMSEILDLATQPSDGEIAAVLRTLPVHRPPDFSEQDIQIKNVEILLVTPAKAVAKLLSQQMMACGFRVHAVHDPIEGLVSALRFRPEMVITSQEMKGMSGVDLVCALKVVAATSRVPCAILTSHGSEASAFAALPPGVSILRTGPHFAEDFANCITECGLG